MVLGEGKGGKDTHGPGARSETLTVTGQVGRFQAECQERRTQRPVCTESRPQPWPRGQGGIRSRNQESRARVVGVSGQH